MQPLAIGALAVGALMVIGVVVMLIRTRREDRTHRGGMNRWNRHGSLPLAVAGVAIGALSHEAGQSSATHAVVFAVAAALLLAALVCALVGAVVASVAARSGLRG